MRATQLPQPALPNIGHKGNASHRGFSHCAAFVKGDHVDLAKLDQIEQELTEFEQRQELGHFDPGRMPRIDIRAVEKVTDFHMAVSPDCSYRLVKSTIDQAEEELLVYIYNLSADYLLDLLRDAKRRGVTIRLMYDTTDTRDNERQKVSSLGVDVKEAPSSGTRQVFTVCHQKYVVIDSSVLLIESANWATTSIPLLTIPHRYKKGNREWLLRIDHTPLAEWFKNLFEKDWDIPEMERPDGQAVAQPPAEEGLMLPSGLAKIPAKIFDLGDHKLEKGVRVTPVISPVNYFEIARDLIKRARKSIYLQQQYVLAGGPKTKALLKALGERKDDLDIRIMVSPAFRKIGKKDSWELSRDSLDAVGLRDRLRALNLNFFTHLHNKGLAIDKEVVVVSSTNWSENSITKAREAGVVVESPKIASYYADAFEFDWGNGIDEADLPDNLAAPTVGGVAVEEDRVEVHPADLRII